MIRFRSVFLLSAAAILAAPVLPAQDSALLAAEQARGVLQGKKGVKWTVRVNSTGGDGGEKSAKFEAISQGGKVFAEIEEPADAKGRKYIAEADGKMWFWKPGLTRPVSVSKRQRLTGDAAIGDIASTSFVEGYKVKGKTDGTLDGEPVTVYTMSANSLGDTYKEIKYWVTNSGNLGKKAEFFAKSGTLVRTATMEYENTANGGPFLSKMVIQDGARTVTLSFSDVEIGSYQADLFDRNKLDGGIQRAKPKSR